MVSNRPARSVTPSESEPGAGLAPGGEIPFPRRVRALRRLVYWLPATAWMALIFFGSTEVLSGNRTSRFIAPLVRWLMPELSEEGVFRIVFAVRKAAHVSEYALLAGLVLAAMHGTFRLVPREWSWPRAGRALLVCAVYALSDELHQAFVPARFGNPLDVLIDTAGAGGGLLVIWAWGRWRQRRSAPGDPGSASAPADALRESPPRL